jgi:hypothetical protein
MEHTGRSASAFRRWSRFGGAPCRILGVASRSLWLRFFPPVRSLLFLISVVLLSGSTAAQTVRYVDADATGAADGSSWAEAFVHLQGALAVAAAGDEVWVAEGTYRPTDGGPDPTDRDASFVLPSGVRTYGGFDGTETTRDERDWEAHPTVLSGDIGAPGDFSDNAFHVVTASGVDASTVLDGFTVSGGYGNGANPRNRGAGIYGVDASLVVRNVRIVENRVVQTDGFGGGGGVFFEGVGALRFERVAFERNGGNAIGGGLWLLGEGGAASEAEVIRRHGAHLADADHDVGVSHIDVAERRAEGRRLGSGGLSAALREVSFAENTGSFGGAMKVERATLEMVVGTFERNAAQAAGGGVHSTLVAGDFVNVTFRGNTSAPDEFISGGGGVIDSGSSLDFTNVTFTGNVGRLGGGLTLGGGTTSVLTNVMFTANESPGEGGGIRVSSGSNALLRNVVLWGNDDEIALRAGTATLNHALVEGGCPSEVTCEALLDADPLFARGPDPGPDETWGTGDDDYGDLRLQVGSPAVDFGLTSFLPLDTFDLDADGDIAEPLPVDLAGEPRVVGASVDLGAYERQPPVAVEPELAGPAAVTLDVYPNPARGPVAVVPRLDRAEQAEVALFDVLGRQVAVLHDGPLAAGRHAFRLATAALPSGVYLLRLSGETSTVTRRVVVLR